ncbi:MAG TPA: bifunctional phosphoglucose/phosphomannose isomerase [Candidatus Aenigmarchaeota archaeon]|nr:MAG: bifunctional phosphoglucose/phosphomannose isomerase [Candidatus Aenigmarchaeota archaeon]HDD46369.1 bifunctional phosphoglucose/phosphomannose isomerase [Candidatus Aenigmarchaeota archaeon]
MQDSRAGKANILDDEHTLLMDSGIYNIVENIPEHSKNALRIARTALKGVRIDRECIAVCGMGGSAISGDIFRCLVNKRVEVVRDYKLPVYIDKDYFLIAISYSGNTEETISCVNEAYERGIELVGISSNGILEELCRKWGKCFVKVPEGMPPRSALPYLLFPLLVLAEKSKMISVDFESLIDMLSSLKKRLGFSRGSSENEAKRIALAVKGRIPVIYSFHPYTAVAYRAKTQFNENSKIQAFSEVLPELNHNSILGWRASMGRNFCVIFIRDGELENEKLKKRIEFTENVIKRAGGRIIEIEAEGKNLVEKMFSVIYLLDFASIYLGLLNGVDPTETKLISKLKKYVGERGK